jgi:hypothetical protein
MLKKYQSFVADLQPPMRRHMSRDKMAGFAINMPRKRVRHNHKKSIEYYFYTIRLDFSLSKCIFSVDIDR